MPWVYSTQSFADDHKLIAPPTVPVPGAIADPATRIEIKQESTGPVVTYRRWFRREAVRTLILGDVRTLLARVYEMGLPVHQYEIAALRSSGSQQRVHFISPRRRTSSPAGAVEPDSA
ncbi:hypothetical protein AB0F91_45630 [Amycolatopsis sp. NPDC023774]|uniref:hypothetical protein n=1 Tax=Amycolatopsis sp. NPDC023774 TaxID=3155015 RepID=UPI0033CC66F1